MERKYSVKNLVNKVGKGLKYLPKRAVAGLLIPATLLIALAVSKPAKADYINFEIQPDKDKVSLTYNRPFGGPKKVRYKKDLGEILDNLSFEPYLGKDFFGLKLETVPIAYSSSKKDTQNDRTSKKFSAGLTRAVRPGSYIHLLQPGRGTLSFLNPKAWEKDYRKHTIGVIAGDAALAGGVYLLSRLLEKDSPTPAPYVPPEPTPEPEPEPEPEPTPEPEPEPEPEEEPDDWTGGGPLSKMGKINLLK